MKGLIEAILGLANEPKPVAVNDPDDYMGTDAFAITRLEAESRTAKNGAYAFHLPEVPSKTVKLCSWSYPPCSINDTDLYATMRVVPYFCLFREGIADPDIKKVCSPSDIMYPVQNGPNK